MGTSYSTDLSSSVIDLHELSNSVPSQQESLVKSFFERGFIILKLDTKSIELLKTMYELSDDFFSQPEKVKIEVSMNLSKKENHPEGYLRVGNLRETLKVDFFIFKQNIVQNR